MGWFNECVITDVDFKDGRAIGRTMVYTFRKPVFCSWEGAGNPSQAESPEDYWKALAQGSLYLNIESIEKFPKPMQMPTEERIVTEVIVRGQHEWKVSINYNFGAVSGLYHLLLPEYCLCPDSEPLMARRWLRHEAEGDDKPDFSVHSNRQALTWVVAWGKDHDNRHLRTSVKFRKYDEPEFHRLTSTPPHRLVRQRTTAGVREGMIEFSAFVAAAVFYLKEKLP